MAGDSPNMSSTSTDWNLLDESPTSSADSSTCNNSYFSGSPIAGGWTTSPKRSLSSPLPRKKIIEELEASSTASSRVSSIPSNKVLLKPAHDMIIPANFVASKLPPPPPGGSKVGGYFVSRGQKLAALVVPDLLEFWRSGLNPVSPNIGVNWSARNGGCSLGCVTLVWLIHMSVEFQLWLKSVEAHSSSFLTNNVKCLCTKVHIISNPLPNIGASVQGMWLQLSGGGRHLGSGLVDWVPNFSSGWKW